MGEVASVWILRHFIKLNSVQADTTISLWLKVVCYHIGFFIDEFTQILDGLNACVEFNVNMIIKGF